MTALITAATGAKTLEFGVAGSTGHLLGAFILAADALAWVRHYRTIDPEAKAFVMSTGQPFTTVSEAYAARATSKFSA